MIKPIQSPATQLIRSLELELNNSSQPAEPEGVAGIQDAVERVKDAAANSTLFQSNETSESSPVIAARNAAIPEMADEILAATVEDLVQEIDVNNLDNLRLLVKTLVPEMVDSYLDRLLGSATEEAAGNNSTMDSIRDSSVARDRVGDLLGAANGGFVGSDLGQVSQDASETQGSDGNQVEYPSAKDVFVEIMMAFGLSKAPVAPPTPPDPDTGKNTWDGITFFREVLGMDNYNNHVNKRGGVDTNGTPNPEAPDSGPPRIITPELLIGIATRKGMHGEPNPESQDGTGGPINETKARGGATGPAGEPAIEIDRAVATARDFDALRIRLESKFLKS